MAQARLFLVFALSACCAAVPTWNLSHGTHEWLADSLGTVEHESPIAVAMEGVIFAVLGALVLSRRRVTGRN